MNPEVKKQWLEALRSGNYQQCQERLCTNSTPENEQRSYCCLGVLCDIAAKQGIGKWGTPHDGAYSVHFLDTHEDHSLSYPPTEVSRWAGLENNDPMIDDECLSSYNDKHSYSFKQIADLIEKNL